MRVGSKLVRGGEMKTRWEVSCMELVGPNGVMYKVTPGIGELSVAETKLFSTKREARVQLDRWLC